MGRRLCAVVGSLAMLIVAGGCGGNDAEASKDDYCAAAKSVGATMGQDNSESATAEQSITDLVTAIQSAADIAPSEIESEAATVAAGAKSIQAVWAANGYDSDKTGADPAYAEATQNEEYKAAHTSVDEYNATECGLTTAWP